MARAKKDSETNYNKKFYNSDYYLKDENWLKVEDVLAICFKKIDVLNELKMNDEEFTKLILAKGFETFIEARNHYRGKLNTAIGIEFLKKIKSGMASEKFLQFAIEKVYLPDLIRNMEDEKLSSAEGVVVEKPIFEFDDKDNNLTLEFLTLKQQNNVEEELQKMRLEDEANDENK